VAFLSRFGRPPPAPTTAPTEESVPWSVERATPGIAALLEGVGEARTHAVLDLGPAAHTSLRVYGVFAGRVRFADILEEVDVGPGSTAALELLTAQPEQPYDLVFAWNLLDRLFPEDRPRMMKRLTEITSPDARLHILVDSSDRPETDPLRFALLEKDRLRYEPTGPAKPAKRRPLPAEVEQLLQPFRVLRAFTLKGGFREYVATRQPRR
jgi:hypothetical protein